MAESTVSPSERQGAWTRENGEALRVARKEKRLTIEALAKLIGAHPRKVAAWEAGEHGPSRQRAMLIVRELDMDSSEWGKILGGVEPEGAEWAKFKDTPEYKNASEDAIRFVRTMWLPENAHPTCEWYKGALAMFGMLPRQ